MVNFTIDQIRAIMDDQHDAKKLWVFGPETTGPNLLVDQTKAVQYLNEIRDSMESAFQWVTKEGVVAEESMRGIRFNILDVELHADAIHRGGAQIIPTARRVYYACEITANPRFQEPIYLCDIATPSDVMNGVYQCFSQRRGVVFSEESVQGLLYLLLKLIFLSQSLSDSLPISDHLPQDKPSLNVFSLIGISSTKILSMLNLRHIPSLWE